MPVALKLALFLVYLTTFWADMRLTACLHYILMGVTSSVTLAVRYLAWWGVEVCDGRQTFGMSKICQVTGRKPAFGNNVSHSHRKTRRRWNPNIQNKRFWVPSEKRWVTLTVSARGIKTINKNGIESVLADMRRRGEKV